MIYSTLKFCRELYQERQLLTMWRMQFLSNRTLLRLLLPHTAGGFLKLLYRIKRGNALICFATNKLKEIHPPKFVFFKKKKGGEGQSQCIFNLHYKIINTVRCQKGEGAQNSLQKRFSTSIFNSKFFHTPKSEKFTKSIFNLHYKITNNGLFHPLILRTRHLHGTYQYLNISKDMISSEMLLLSSQYIHVQGLDKDFFTEW